MTRKFSPWAAAVAAMLSMASVAAYADSTTAPPPPPPPPPAPTVVATPPPSANAPHLVPPPAPTAPKKPLVAPKGVAATVDNYVIKESDVDKLAIQLAGPQASTQLINFYIIDREAEKEGVTVSDAEIDKKLDEIRQRVAPMTLEAALKQHNMTLPVLQQILKHNLELDKCATKDVKPVDMVHVRHILIKVSATPATTSTTAASDKSHTDAEALAIIKNIQDQLKAGKKFEDLAKQYSEDPSNKDQGGDLTGLVYTGSYYQPDFTKAALALKPGEITTTPAKSSFGYHLIECISSNTSHPASEDKLYDDAAHQYMEQQASTKSPALMQSLLAKAKVVNYLAQ